METRHTSGVIPAACCGLGAQPLIRSDFRLVLVDSIVADRQGAYVHGLTQKDFTVWEDGKQQTITTFSFQAGAASSGDRQPHNLVLVFLRLLRELLECHKAQTVQNLYRSGEGWSGGCRCRCRPGASGIHAKIGPG